MHGEEQIFDGIFVAWVYECGGREGADFFGECFVHFLRRACVEVAAAGYEHGVACELCVCVCVVYDMYACCVCTFMCMCVYVRYVCVCLSGRSRIRTWCLL